MRLVRILSIVYWTVISVVTLLISTCDKIRSKLQPKSLYLEWWWTQCTIHCFCRNSSAKVAWKKIDINRLAACPALPIVHCVEWLRFVLQHRDWTIGQWSSVLFTEEYLCSFNGREHVSRKPDEPFVECYMSPRTAFGDSSMGWRFTAQCLVYSHSLFSCYSLLQPRQPVRTKPV